MWAYPQSLAGFPSKNLLDFGDLLLSGVNLMLICEFCEQEMEPRIYRGGIPKRFCSRKCKRAAWAKTPQGQAAREANNRGEEARARKRAWNNSAKGVACFARRRAQPDFPIKAHARDAVRQAIRKGILIKANCCEKCGDVSEHLQGHHHKGYEKVLEVQWLCALCHVD